MTATVNVPDLPTLLPGVPVLARHDGCVQVGCHPGTAVFVDVDRGVEPRALARFLHTLREPTDYRKVARQARAVGLDSERLRALLARLVAVGSAECSAAGNRPIPVHIVGRGDVARALTASLESAGVVVTAHAETGLVVIADQPVCDPQVSRSLMAAGIPHMPVHLRDGLGVVGPLVLPGTTSCLRCADLHLTDFDAQWPIVAAGLLDLVGHADPAVLRATVAIAHAQIDEVTTMLAADTDAVPSIVGRTLEFRTGPSRIDSRARPVHPRCGCGVAPMSGPSTILEYGERTP